MLPLLYRLNFVEMATTPAKKYPPTFKKDTKDTKDVKESKKSKDRDAKTSPRSPDTDSTPKKNQKLLQRPRSNSAGCQLSARKTPESGRSRSSSWWRTPEKNGDFPNGSPGKDDLGPRTRIVLAGVDMSPNMSKSASHTPLSTPRGSSSRRSCSPSPQGSPSAFVLVPKAGISSRILSTTEPDENDVVTVTITSGQGGWLETSCLDLFARAYGLNGTKRENHHVLYEEALMKSQCSRRAFLEVLYGHSYHDKLGDLRGQVVNYPEKRPVNKKNKHEREAMLERLAVSMNTAGQKVKLRADAPTFVPSS